MAFKLKSFNNLLSLHPTSNKLDNVIKLVDMPSNRHFGYINESKIIHVNKNITPKQMSETIRHEKVHKKQMEEGRLDFNSLRYKWKPGRNSETITIPTSKIDTKRRDLPWEKEADNKPANIKDKLKGKLDKAKNKVKDKTGIGSGKDLNEYGYSNKEWKKMDILKKIRIEKDHELKTGKVKRSTKGMGEYLKLKGDPRANEVIKALDQDGVPLKHCKIIRNIKRKRR